MHMRDIVSDTKWLNYLCQQNTVLVRPSSCIKSTQCNFRNLQGNIETWLFSPSCFDCQMLVHCVHALKSFKIFPYHRFQSSPQLSILGYWWRWWCSPRWTSSRCWRRWRRRRSRRWRPRPGSAGGRAETTGGPGVLSTGHDIPHYE